MTEREKMIEIVLDTEITGIKLRNITGGISTANAIADALIAANIGDVTEWKERAEVAERALLLACANLVKDEKDNVDIELLARVVYTKFLRKAEKELAEEG